MAKLLRLARLVTRITFSRPKRAEVCIYDKVGSDLLLSELTRRGVTSVVLQVRGESLYLAPLLEAVFRSFLRQGELFDLYVDSFLRLTSSEIVVTTIDNDTRFWRIGARNPHLKTIAIQNGIRGNRFDVFEFDPVKDSRTDFLFCFSEPVGERFRDQGLFEQVIAHGSLKSNQFPIVRSETRGVAWISQYSPDWDNSAVSSEEFHNSEKRAFRLFSEWAVTAGQSLNVLMRGEGKTARDEENWFRENSVSKEILFPSKDSYKSNYGLVDSFELLGTCDSTLGYEALSRGAKVVFFAWRPRQLGALGFGWPENFGDDGPFWNSSMIRTEIIEVLNETLAMSSASFASEFETLISKVMSRDEGNSQLYELLSTLVTSKSD